MTVKHLLKQMLSVQRNISAGVFIYSSAYIMCMAPVLTLSPISFLVDITDQFTIGSI